jgi:hypothetical protein
MEWLTALWALVVTYWPALFTVALPFVVNLIAECSWTAQAKSWTALALSVAIGVVAPFVAGIALTPETIAIFTGAVFTGGTAAYLVFKRIGITNAWLDALLAFGSK